MQELEAMFSPAGSYRSFRDIMKYAEPPVVPYLGLFQSDLMFLDSGNPDFLGAQGNLVNFEKHVRESCVLRTIQKFQSVEYVLVCQI